MRRVMPLIGEWTANLAVLPRSRGGAPALGVTGAWKSLRGPRITGLLTDATVAPGLLFFAFRFFFGLVVRMVAWDRLVVCLA